MSGSAPHSTRTSTVSSAMRNMRDTRGRARPFWRVFSRSLVPMVIVDNQRRYLEANSAGRLLFRLSLEEFRARRIEDLTPPHMFPILRERWSRLMMHGSVSGPYDVQLPDGSELRIVYCALANALPGQHLIVFMPADWPDDELSTVEADVNPPRSGGPLSPRELEVLSLMAVGASLPQIAEELTISVSTVRTHTRNALQKLGAHNRAHAIALAMQHDLIDIRHTGPVRAPSSL